MSAALQCPSCGSTHRLADLGDVTVFRCSSCGRALKVPEQFRSADRTPAKRPTAPKSSVRRPATGRPRLPVRILAWVISFLLGAVVVRTLAKLTGFVGGDTLVDLLLENSFSNYFRLAILVPIWGVFTALIATALLEGPRWYANRRAGTRAPTGAAGASGAAPVKTPPTKVPATPPRTSTGKIARKPSKTPAPAAGVAAGRRPVGSAGDSNSTRHLPAPGAVAEPEVLDEAARRAAAGQRPRRIPRRETGS